MSNPDIESTSDVSDSDQKVSVLKSEKDSEVVSAEQKSTPLKKKEIKSIETPAPVGEQSIEAEDEGLDESTPLDQKEKLASETIPLQVHQITHSEKSVEQDKKTEEIGSVNQNSTSTKLDGEHYHKHKEYLEKFDWEKHCGTVESIGEEKMKSFEREVDKNFSGSVGKSIVKGTIVRIADREAIVDINSKSEGVISLNEFRYNPDLSVGDEVDVIVDKHEDNTGQLVLSHRKARTIRSWEKVNQAHRDLEILPGTIKCRTKGGMIVDINGIEAFLPGSQIDIKPIKDYDQYIEKTLDFRIVKINQEFKNIVVSHKVLIEADMAKIKKELISNLKKGNVLRGTVKNIMSYGVFVDLGSIDGLIHIGDLSWRRISHPSEVVNEEQDIEVVVLDFDKESLKIQLGLKQLEDHPWDKLSADIKEGTQLDGKVVMIHDYGVLVEVENGVEGFMKINDMSWSTYLRSAGEFLSIGDQVKVVVLSIDIESRRLSLGMKQLTKDPWTDITEKYQVGTTHPGTVRQLTDFGAFIELEPGIEGLVYSKDLSWTEKVKHPSNLLSIRDKIDVAVMDIDTKERRLRLGHRQTKPNPWDKYQEQYAVGTIHKFKIDKVIDGGGVINFHDNLQIYVNKRGMITFDGTPLRKGQEAEFKIIEFNKDLSKVIASHKAAIIEKEKDNVKKHQRSASRKDIRKPTFGELEGSVLSDLRHKMKHDDNSPKKSVKRIRRKRDEKPFVVDSQDETSD